MALPLMLAALVSIHDLLAWLLGCLLQPDPGTGISRRGTRQLLSVLQGALIAGANQQANTARRASTFRTVLPQLENGTAAGVLQALEVGNEVGIFASEQDMKLRNATNAQLNALVVAESNRQTRKPRTNWRASRLSVNTAIGTWATAL